ncbi:MAG: hypothetical protein IPJ52_11135 [Rhodocyclaceae bacterium]|nr:hypothetical protein [Rhodocyclaceae bacterium]
MAAVEMVQAARLGLLRQRLPRLILAWIILPVAMAMLVVWLAPHKLGSWVEMALTLGLIVPVGQCFTASLTGRWPTASVLVLFIVSMAVHYALTGIELAMFGGEGLRTNAISDWVLGSGSMKIGAQSIWVVSASVACMVVLWFFFERSLW